MYMLNVSIRRKFMEILGVIILVGILYYINDKIGQFIDFNK